MIRQDPSRHGRKRLLKPILPGRWTGDPKANLLPATDKSPLETKASERRAQANNAKTYLTILHCAIWAVRAPDLRG